MRRGRKRGERILCVTQYLREDRGLGNDGVNEGVSERESEGEKTEVREMGVRDRKEAWGWKLGERGLWVLVVKSG